MAAIHDVLHRLTDDEVFRWRVVQSPRLALAPYGLAIPELEALVVALRSARGMRTPIERRTSLSGLFAVVARLASIEPEPQDAAGTSSRSVGG